MPGAFIFGFLELNDWTIDIDDFCLDVPLKLSLGRAQIGLEIVEVANSGWST